MIILIVSPIHWHGGSYQKKRDDSECGEYMWSADFNLPVVDKKRKPIKEKIFSEHLDNEYLCHLILKSVYR